MSTPEPPTSASVRVSVGTCARGPECPHMPLGLCVRPCARFCTHLGSEQAMPVCVRGYTDGSQVVSVCEGLTCVLRKCVRV